MTDTPQSKRLQMLDKRIADILISVKRTCAEIGTLRAAEALHADTVAKLTAENTRLKNTITATHTKLEYATSSLDSILRAARDIAT